jgi:DNA-directed RNA polymerase alpha subunit
MEIGKYKLKLEKGIYQNHEDKIFYIDNETIKCVLKNFLEDAINEKLKSIDFEDFEYVVNDVEITNHDFSYRTFMVLMEHGILSLNELIKWSPKKLMRLRNFGKKCLAEVEEFVYEKGFRLKKD